MYIDQLQLRNWKNFRRASTHLSKRTFLIGPNAAGKSNLLDAFRFLSDVAATGLSAAVGNRGGISRIRCLAARKSPVITVDVTIAGDSGNPRWRYDLQFSQDSTRTPVVRKERVVDLRSERVVVDRPGPEDQDDPLRLTQTMLEQIVANRDFREVADFFFSISYQHLVPQAVRDPKGFTSAPVDNDPYGRDLVMRLWNTNARTRTAWLRRICSALRQAVPQLQSLAVEMDSQGVPHLVGRYEHWRAHSAKQTETQFSDGTLRLFGLMWSMFEGTGPVLLEEPELSLHPEVVRAIPQMFASLQDEIRKMKRKGTHEQRQVVLSTHSTELLQDLSIGAHEVLLIQPSAEGSTIESARPQDEELLRAGLSAAEVLLPRSAPTGQQLLFRFD
ncbi:AAA family ATPase [Planctomycetota bacterium]